jgi:hypothetical protein
MSQESDAPKTKRRVEILPAIIGLVGVIVGSFATAGVNYWIAVQSQQAEQEKTKQAQRVELKVAARLVTDQLKGVAAGARALFEEKRLQPKAVPFPLDSWDQHKAALARGMNYESFNEVSKAVILARLFRPYLDAALTERQRDRSADGKDFYERAMRGVEALKPYTID